MTQKLVRFTFIKMAALFCLSLGLIFTSCSKKSSAPPTDKTGLKSVLDSAQFYDTKTAEGTKPGEYTVGSKTALATAIAAANAVLNDPNSSQTVLTNATANLQAAINTYKGAYITEIAAASLIGYWKMNGNVNDSSGNGNNGTLSTGATLYGAGLPALTADRFGRANMAYHFDKGGNIEIPYKPSLNPKQMSISLWCKKDTAGRTWAKDGYYLVALDRWNGYKVQFQGTNKAFFTVRTVRVAGDTNYINQDGVVSLLNEQWYHVVVTYKADTMNFYINGTLTHSWTGADAPGAPITAPSTINLTIGQDLPTSKYLTVDGDFQVAWGGFWTGDMDDVMFYNVALTGPQVQSIYNNQNTQ